MGKKFKTIGVDTYAGMRLRRRISSMGGIVLN